MSSCGVRRMISQEAFEEMVRENREDFGMEPAEALEDAVHALSLQGVDLSGIVKCIPGVTSAKDDPVLQTLDSLKKTVAAGAPRQSKLDEMVQLLERLRDLCSSSIGGAGSDNSSVAVRNGAVELLCSICSLVDVGEEHAVVSTLKALSTVLRAGIQSTEIFQNNDGPKNIMHILAKSTQSSNLLECGFAVVAAASTGNEIVKESFMDLKIDELFVQILNGQPHIYAESMYDAIRVLLTPDDNRALASQVYGYARRLAKIGIADALVVALKDVLHSSSMISVCTALKAVAVNDEICRSLSENGVIEVILQCLDESNGKNKAVPKSCCTLLSKLASSDVNKNAIVQKGGLQKLIKLSLRFSDDPSILQEIMTVICTLSLRSPENAAHAVEAGAGDLAVQAMQKFPTAHQMQKQSCLMIRNLVARNPQNRTILLNNGIEKLIRKAKGSHESCKDAARDALRDLGLDDYH